MVTRTLAKCLIMSLVVVSALADAGVSIFSLQFIEGCFPPVVTVLRNMLMAASDEDFFSSVDANKDGFVDAGEFYSHLWQSRTGGSHV